MGDESLLPQTIETPVEDNPEQVKLKEKTKVTSTTKTKKKFQKSFLSGASSVFQMLLFIVFWLAPGFLLGFGGGSYYQYKRLAPYVQQNWRLSTELLKLERIVSFMDNLIVYDDKWEYRMKQGFIECNYNPYLFPEAYDDDYETKEYSYGKKNNKESASTKEDSKNDLGY